MTAWKRYPRLQARRRRKRRCYALVGAGLLCCLLAVQGYVNSQEQARQQAQQANITYTLPGQTFYALQVAQCAAEEEALSLAETFLARGAAGYVFQDGEICRVLAAAYDSRADALRVQENLRTYHNVDTVLHVLTAPDVEMRFAGTKAQLDALTQGLDFLCALSGELKHLFVSLDAGSADVKDAQEMLASYLSTAKSLLDRVESAFKRAGNPWADGLCAGLENVKDAVQQALQKNSDVRFGAYVKQAHLSAVCAMWQLGHLGVSGLSYP